MNTALFARRHTSKECEATKEKEGSSIVFGRSYLSQSSNVRLCNPNRTDEEEKRKTTIYLTSMTVHSRSLVQLSTGDLYIYIFLSRMYILASCLD